MLPARDRNGLCAFGAVLVALAGIYWKISMRTNVISPVEPFVALYVTAFLIYVYACGRLIPSLEPYRRYVVPAIFLAGVAFRLVLVHSAPSLSTDIYRYVWDGRLTTHGINPYQYAPYDVRLANLRDGAIWGPMEYKAYQTIYMPVSQAFFAFGSLIFGNNLSAFKFMYTAFDIGVMALVLMILRQRKFPLVNLAWYALCPLPIVEVSLAGHQDPAGVFFLMCALYLVLRSRPLKAGILIVAAGFTKGFAFLLLPLFMRRFGVRFAAYVFVALAVLGLPLWVCLPKFLHGASQYLTNVHANSGLFYLIDHLMERILMPIPSISAFMVTARICNILVLSVLIWSVWTKPHSQAELIRRSVVVICTCLLLTATLFPWYVLWMLPLAVVQKPKPSYGIITLTGSVGFMYLVYVNQSMYPWMRALEYVPVYLLLAYEIKTGYWGALLLGRREDGDSVEETGASATGASAALDASTGAAVAVGAGGPAAAKY